MLEHQRLIAISTPCLLDRGVAFVVVPADIRLRRRFHLVHDRTSDPFSHSFEEARKDSGPTTPFAVRVELARVDLDLTFTVTQQWRSAIPAAGDHHVAFHATERQ